MSRPPRDMPLRASVLDRLVGDREGAASGSAQRLRDIQESVRRDLENLLNTRRHFLRWPEELEELESSLINYGVPDFTAESLGRSADRQWLIHELEDVIRRFEPRLSQVRVALAANDDPTDRAVRFRIEARLIVAADAQPVTYDSTLDTASGVLQVRRSAR